MPGVETPKSKSQFPQSSFAVVAANVPPFKRRASRWHVDPSPLSIALVSLTMPPALMVIVMEATVAPPTNELSPPTVMVEPLLTVTLPPPTAPVAVLPALANSMPPLTIVPPL